jgi:hypothetical protein
MEKLLTNSISRGRIMARKEVANEESSKRFVVKRCSRKGAKLRGENGNECKRVYFYANCKLQKVKEKKQ